jgi:hypothetical protein
MPAQEHDRVRDSLGKGRCPDKLHGAWIRRHCGPLYCPYVALAAAILHCGVYGRSEPFYIW